MKSKKVKSVSRKPIKVHQKHHKPLINLVVVFVLIAFVLGYGLGGGYLEREKEIIEPVVVKEVELVEGANQVIIKTPAVDKEGNGVITELIVTAMPGNGKTLVDIDSLLFWTDTQNSIRMAKLVASEHLGAEIANFDVIYDLKAEATLIGGPSAGAALAVATVAALEGKKVREDVMITGSINHDGSIGPVGGIYDKAKAAGENDAILFLVPLLQGNEIVYDNIEHCQKFGVAEVCNVEQIPRTVDVQDEVGIEIKEVGNIEEALDLFYI
jgi:uncharacterized protein